MIIALTIAIVSQIVAPDISSKISKVIALNHELGFELEPTEDSGTPVNAGGMWSVDVRSRARGRRTNLLFTEGWRLAMIRNYGPTSHSSSTDLSRYRTIIERFAKDVEWLRPSEIFATEINPSGSSVQVFPLHGSMREYQRATFSFVDGCLRSAVLPDRIQNTQYNLASPRLSNDVLLGKALTHLSSYNPKPNGAILNVSLYYGFPVATVGVEDPPLTARLQADYELKHPFPFLFVCVGDAYNNPGRYGTWINVDARDGSLCSIIPSGSGFGGKGSLRALPLDPNKVTIDRTTGSLRAVGKIKTSPPESKAKPIPVRSGKGVWFAKTDADNHIWLCLDAKKWQAYVPNPALRKAISRASR